MKPQMREIEPANKLLVPIVTMKDFETASLLVETTLSKASAIFLS